MSNSEINEDGVRNATYFLQSFSEASTGASAELIFVSFWLKCLPGAAECLKTVPSF